MSGVVGDFGALLNLQVKLGALATPSARVSLCRNLAEEYRSFMTECFQSSKSPYGEAWAPLRFRKSSGGYGQKPLLNSGLMKGAIAPINVTATGFRVQVGRKFATTHQFGATIRPKQAKALRFAGVTFTQKVSKLGRRSTSKKWGNFVFAKKVVIPPRPFAPLNGIPAELDSLFHEAADEFIRDHLGE